MTAADPQLFYIMLALPTLFGLTLLGEGVYKIRHYESGWGGVITGVVFIGIVAFGYFYIRGWMGNN